MSIEQREFIWLEKDAIGGHIPGTKATVTEQQIASFCGKCDNLGAGNVCRLGSNDQGRYVHRGWCRWATVAGKRGTMSRSGFSA